MLISISKKSKQSLHSQIFDQLKVLIENGTIAIGEKLDPSRKLALTLGVNRSTVVRAYEDLIIKGYVESTPGGYTIVRKRKPNNPTRDSNKSQAYDALTLEHIFRSDIDLPYDLMMHYLENNKQIEDGKINFLQLYPDSRLLEQKEIKSTMKKTLAEGSDNPFSFTQARGYPPLRELISKQMNLRSVYTQDDNVLITNGTMQSLQLIFQVFSQPGDYIVIEKPSYSIIHLLIKIFKLIPIEVAIAKEGIDVKALSVVLEDKNVRFVYVMPTFQNPTGISMSAENRREFISICSKYNCIILEDGIEEELSYSGIPNPPLKSIDNKGQIIYLGTYSKVLAPGLRIGWIVSSLECIKKLTVVKSIAEISSSSIGQMFMYNFIKDGLFDVYLKKISKVVRRRMKVAISSIKYYVPENKIEWIEPAGGYMIWLKLLTKKQEHIEHYFMNQNVLIHNGKYFFLTSQEHDYIRICIAQTNESEIDEGIKRIGDTLKNIT